MSINDLPPSIVDKIYSETTEEILEPTRDRNRNLPNPPITAVAGDNVTLGTMLFQPGTFMHARDYRAMRNFSRDVAEPQLARDIARKNVEIAQLQQQMDNALGMVAVNNQANIIGQQLRATRQLRDNLLERQRAIAAAKANYPSMVYFKIMMDRR